MTTILKTALKPRRCPHCHSHAQHMACVRCGRDMCADCISYHAIGKVCGLCYDEMEEDEAAREDAR